MVGEVLVAEAMMVVKVVMSRAMKTYVCTKT